MDGSHICLECGKYFFLILSLKQYKILLNINWYPKMLFHSG